MPTQTRAKRRKTQALLIEQVFSKPAAHILRRLLSFGDPRSLGNAEATGRLLGGRGQVEGEARSLVELAVRDRLAALGRLDLAWMEAPRLAAGGGAWSELLLFAMRLPSAPHRRIDGGGDFSLAIKEGALYSCGGGLLGAVGLGHGDGQKQARPKRVEGALAGETVVSVATGNSHVVALTAAGSWPPAGHCSEQSLRSAQAPTRPTRRASPRAGTRRYPQPSHTIAVPATLREPPPPLSSRASIPGHPPSMSGSTRRH